MYPIMDPKKLPSIIPAYIPFKPHPNIIPNKYANIKISKNDLMIVSIKQYNPLPIASNSADDIIPIGINRTYKLNKRIVDAI